MSPGPIQLDQATALTLMLGPNGSVGIQASSNFPRFDRNLNAAKSVGEGTEADIAVATHLIHHDEAHPSSLLLPVVPR